MLRNMNNKGNLTFSQIVMAIIALIVLIVLLATFAHKMFGINKEASACTGVIGGTCHTSPCPSDYIHKFGNFSDCKKEEVCCISVFGSGKSSDTT